MLRSPVRDDAYHARVIQATESKPGPFFKQIIPRQQSGGHIFCPDIHTCVSVGSKCGECCLAAFGFTRATDAGVTRA